MNGKFFAVGIGPGDPELLTIKAVKTIQKSDIIAVPMTNESDSLAEKIAKEYIENKEILHLNMPMTKNKEELQKSHINAAELISSHLKEGKNVSFLTLGDPTIYSTAMYVHKILTNMGYDTNVVSGITSFCAVGASLNQSLCEKDEILHIIPTTFSDLEYVSSLKGNKILMKSGRTIGKVKEKFKEKNAMAVEKATMKDEKIYKNLQEIDENASYFSIVFVKEEN